MRKIMRLRTSKDSLFTCGKGQIYIFEAVLAVIIVIGAVFFMVESTPSPGTYIGDFSSLQLKKYADDILEILSFEDPQKLRNLVDTNNHTSPLYEWVKDCSKGDCSNFDDNFYKIGLELDRLSIAYKAEIVRVENGVFEEIHCNGTCVSISNAVSSFRVLIIDGEVYEVRLTLWYV